MTSASQLQKKAAVGYCVGSASFVPDEQTWFRLPDDDAYVYHAVASVTLAQVQKAVGLLVGEGSGPEAGGPLHRSAWYPDADEDGRPLPPPPQADIEAYVSIFQPGVAAASALRSFLSSAKKASVRLRAAQHLAAKRFLIAPDPPPAPAPAADADAADADTADTSTSPAPAPSPPSRPGLDPGVIQALQPLLRVPKAKKAKASSPPPPPPPLNPYFDFWAWSCRALRWCGPTAALDVAGLPAPRGHPALAVLMHHFSCAVPSHEALCLVRNLAAGRAVADVGSGNGYWAFMLRRYGVTVVPVDSGQSAWRTMWVGDTVEEDGRRWLEGAGAEDQGGRGRGKASERQRQQGGGKKGATGGGGKDMLLLLVYPIVGGGLAGGVEGGFTRGLVGAYRGDTIVVVGTQNHNGYTGFRNMTMDQFMERETPEWVRIAQIPLPSFAGKDEALYAFRRRPTAAE